MLRRLVPILLALSFLIGCSGPSKLTDRSEEKLAQGDAWRAWQLATRALDKEPGNPRARAAATAASASIAEEWQRQIRALAETDSMRAAEETLELAKFRENAARVYYQRGREAADSGRPKRAYDEFSEAERFVPGYRDVTKRADRAYRQAVTGVAVAPFRAPSGDPSLGIQVAQAWRDNLVQSLTPPETRFTRILGGDAIEQSMTISELQGLSREDAIQLGREVGAQRIVWGSLGAVRSSTRLNLFRDTVARRVVVREANGRESVRWVDVPIEVVARVRDVTVGIDYEVIATKNGASISHRRFDRSTSARVVWTSYQPEDDPSAYVLVSEVVRAQNPGRAKDVEKRWKSACGDATTLNQVLEARRSSGSSGHYAREALPRFVAGAAFVFLEELPPANDLALGALAQASGLLRDDLLRLDAIDEVDLYTGVLDAPSP